MGFAGLVKIDYLNQINSTKIREKHVFATSTYCWHIILRELKNADVVKNFYEKNIGINTHTLVYKKKIYE